MMSSTSILRRERLARFASAGIYLVITEEFTAGRGTLETLKMAADGGIKLVQLREKHLPKRDLYFLAESFRKVCDEYGILMMMNDHLDIALSVGADGVHLGQDDLPLEAALRLTSDLIIGRSTHSREEALAEQSAGAPAINLGPIYATGTKSLPMAPTGLDLITSVKDDLHIPFSVMGGIKARHIPELRERGANLIAMVTEITQAPDVTGKVKELLALMGK